MRIKPVTTLEVERMCAMARAGLGIIEIARATKRHHGTVRQYTGDLIPKGQRRKVDVERIRSLAASGRSYAYIAAEVGCSEGPPRRYAHDIRKDRKRSKLERLLRDHAATERGNFQDLAERYGYASVTSLHVAVHRLRRQRGLLPWRRVSEQDIARMHELARDGASFRQIAREMQRNHKTVRKYMQQSADLVELREAA
jgi:hypothetical protein